MIADEWQMIDDMTIILMTDDLWNDKRRNSEARSEDAIMIITNDQ